jgi:hypothetical protein
MVWVLQIGIGIKEIVVQIGIGVKEIVVQIVIDTKVIGARLKKKQMGISAKVIITRSE